MENIGNQGWNFDSLVSVSSHWPSQDKDKVHGCVEGVSVCPEEPRLIHYEEFEESELRSVHRKDNDKTVQN